MTRIVFYINVADYRSFLRIFLHRKIFLPQQTALIYGAEKTLQELDSTLWDNNIFLPHQWLSAAAAESAITVPITLTAEMPPPEFRSDMLILLSPEVPVFIGAFPVCIDIVGNSEESKQAGRQRYSYFRDNGYSVDLIDMKSRN